MAGDEGHGVGEECLTGLDAGPGRGAGGMGKRDEVEFPAVEGGAETRADDLIHAGAGDEALDGEAADRDDEFGLQEEDFLAEPLGAVFDFGGIWDAIAAGRVAAGEATAYGGHVNVSAKYFFVYAGVLLEPRKEALAGSPGEGTAEHGFADAGGLADEEDATKDGAA